MLCGRGFIITLVLPFFFSRRCMVVVIFFVAGFDMTARHNQTRNATMTTVDPADLMQSPLMSGFVQTSQRCVVARCTPIQPTSSDVTRYSPSTGKCQVDMLSTSLL